MLAVTEVGAEPLRYTAKFNQPIPTSGVVEILPLVPSPLAREPPSFPLPAVGNVPQTSESQHQEAMLGYIALQDVCIH